MARRKTTPGRGALETKADDATSSNRLAALLRETDVPECSPPRRMHLSEAGICGVTLQSIIVNPFVSPRQPIPARLCAEVALSVPPNRKGLHMSRLVEALASAPRPQSIEVLTERVRKRAQRSHQAHESSVRIVGDVEVSSTTPVTVLHTTIPVRIGCSSWHSPRSSGSDRLVSVLFMNACPCVFARSHNEFVRQLGRSFRVGDIETIMRLSPRHTHTQRGRLTVEVSGPGEMPRYSSILRAIQKATIVPGRLVKAPDEQEFCAQAVERLQYCEDVVREVAHEMREVLGARARRDLSMRVRARVFESVHAQDLFATYLADDRRQRASPLAAFHSGWPKLDDVGG